MKDNMNLRKYLIIIIIMLFLEGCVLSNQSSAFSEQKHEGQQTAKECELRNYYYNQLNDIEKTIYDDLYDSKERFLNKEEVVFAIHPYDENVKLGYLYYYKLVKRAIQAYTYDNPEAEIWFDNYQREYFREQGYTYMKLVPIENIKDKCNVSYEKDTERAVNELQQQANEFISTLKGTDVEKLRKIHDWIAKRAIYDETLELPNTRTAYGTIVKGRSVCSGFAYSYKYLADLAGLDVMYVTGKAYDKKNDTFVTHAWNVVNLNGEYLLVDVTFDNVADGKIRTDYFLSKLNDAVHYPNTYYFEYPFK